MGKFKTYGLSLVATSILSMSIVGCGGGDSSNTTPTSNVVYNNTLGMKEVEISQATQDKITNINNITLSYDDSDSSTLIDTTNIKNDIKDLDGVIIEEQSSDSESEYLRYTIDGYGFIINDRKSNNVWSSGGAILPTNPKREYKKSNTKVTNKEALVLNPFSYMLKESGLEYDVTTELQNAGYNVTYLQDEEVKLLDLANIGSFDFVYLATHSNKQGVISTIIEAKENIWNIGNAKIYKQYFNGKWRWAIYPSFYEDLNIKFNKKPVFYLHMCEALHINSQLDDVFIEKGARAILGWDIAEEFSWGYGLDKDFLTDALAKDRKLRDSINYFRDTYFLSSLVANCDKETDSRDCEDRSFDNLYNKDTNWKTIFNTNDEIILNPNILKSYDGTYIGTSKTTSGDTEWCGNSSNVTLTLDNGSISGKAITNYGDTSYLSGSISENGQTTATSGSGSWDVTFSGNLSGSTIIGTWSVESTCSGTWSATK
ncbi:MAG: hypothetical protein U9O56_00395 [Campylobacterota bacterium]|nr:hypothetical protein [Campylobacterota bacterium]